MLYTWEIQKQILINPDIDKSILIPPEDIAKTVIYMLKLSDNSWVDEIYIRIRAVKPF